MPRPAASAAWCADDLTATLLDLARRREAGEVPAYARVLIETSGLADPAPDPACADDGCGGGRDARAANAW